MEHQEELSLDHHHLIWRGPAQLGEGPLWHPKEQVLYWLDCIAPELHRLDTATGQHKKWTMPALIGKSPQLPTPPPTHTTVYISFC